MARLHKTQRGRRHTLGAYLAGRRRQNDRAWQATPAGFLARLGFDVSHFRPGRRIHSRTSWLSPEPEEMLEDTPEETNEAPVESEVQPASLYTLERVEEAAFAVSEPLRPGEAEAADALAAPMPAAIPPARTIEAEVAPAAVEPAPPSTAPAHAEALKAAPPLLGYRRARIEEAVSGPLRAEAGAPTPPASTGERVEPIGTVNDPAGIEPGDPAQLLASSNEGDQSPAAWAKRIARLIAAEQQPKAAARLEAPRQKLKQTPEKAMTESTAAGASPESDMPNRPGSRFVPPSPAPERAEELPATTRRFLHPLLGFDPADVPVLRGAFAQAITREWRADAAAIGELVVVKPEYAEGSPEQIGVLAHELTHVARRREPRFVPPIARDVWTSGAAAFEPMAEESLARRVEGRVIRAARAAKFVPPPPDATRSGAGFPPSPIRRPPREEIGGAAPAQASTSKAVAPVESPPAIQNAAITRSLPLPAFAAFASGPVESAPPVQLAEIGRGVENEVSPPPQTAPRPDGKASVAPDLDALARQVYGILKRRLANEQRREFFT